MDCIVSNMPVPLSFRQKLVKTKVIPELDFFINANLWGSI